MFPKFFLWYETVTLSPLSQTSENSRSNLNSEFPFSHDPVHWVETFLKNFFSNFHKRFPAKYPEHLEHFWDAFARLLLFKEKNHFCFSLAFIIVINCKINLTQQNFDIFKITMTNTQSSLPPSVFTLTWKFMFYVALTEVWDPLEDHLTHH